MERISAGDIDKAIFRGIGLVCARDEARIDIEIGMSFIEGQSEIFNVQARSRLEEIEGKYEFWHSVSFYDKQDANDFYEIQVNDSGMVLYADNDTGGKLKEMDLSDQNSRDMLWSTFMQLDGVAWYSYQT